MVEVATVKSRYLIGTCLGALMSFSVGIQAHAASLETELSLMLAEHPQLRAAIETSKGAEKNIGVQGAGNLPTVEFNSDYGYEWITNPTERSANAKGDSSMMRQVAGLTVTQNLFDGFATESAVKTAEIGKKESKTTEESTRQSLIFEGISAYLEVLKQVRRINSALENEANIKRQMELEDERVQRGSGIGIDVLNAKSRLQTAIDQRVGYEGQLAQASDQYLQVFGHAPDIAAMLDPSPPLDLLPQTMEEAIDIAVKNNPNLINSELAADKAKEAKRGVMAEYYPTVDLVGAMNYENDKNATEGTRRDWSVIVEANWTLFSGFSTRYSSQKAAFDYGASKNTAAYTLRKTVEGVRRAWHEMETTQQRLALKENDLVLKEEIFLSTRKQRESGAEGVDVLNVLDREKEVSQTRIEYADLFYDTRRAIYSVLFSIGRLTPDTLNVEANES